MAKEDRDITPSLREEYDKLIAELQAERDEAVEALEFEQNQQPAIWKQKIEAYAAQEVKHIAKISGLREKVKSLRKKYASERDRADLAERPDSAALKFERDQNRRHEAEISKLKKENKKLNSKIAKFGLAPSFEFFESLQCAIGSAVREAAKKHDIVVSEDENNPHYGYRW